MEFHVLSRPIDQAKVTPMCFVVRVRNVRFLLWDSNKVVTETFLASKQ